MFNIATINIKGAGTQKSIDYLKYFIVKNDIDVACLQEVGKSISSFQHQDYTKIININLNSNCGTAIIYKKNIVIQSQEMDLENRIIKIKMDEVTIINVYAYPRGATYLAEQRNRFFSTDLQRFLNQTKEYTIMMGNFNATTNDKKRGNFSKTLDNLIKGLDLLDAFKLKNPEDESPTFVSPQGSSQIDKILFPSYAQHNIINAHMVHYIHSDHNAIIVNMLKETIKPKTHPSPYWKLNVSLIDDIDYALNIENILNNSNPKDTKAHLWWENYLKPKIKKISIELAKENKRERRNHENYMERVLSELNKKIEKGETEALQLYLKLKSNRKQEQVPERMNGLQVRGGFRAPIPEEEIGLAHALNEKKKAKSKFIEKLKNPKTNEMVSSEKGKRRLLNNYYENLYKLEVKDPSEYKNFENQLERKVTKEENEMLTMSISEVEVRAAIKELPKGKSPGMDGLPSEFYQHFTHILTPILTKVFNDSIKDQLTDSQRTGAVSLVAKGGERTELKNWRPIALLCVDYKILAKVMTNRFKKVLNRIIEPAQVGALPGRNITANLVTIRNILLNSHEQAPGAIITLDLEKAYDKVDRDNLYRSLKKFNFNHSFIEIIKKMYDHSQASFILNGVLGKKIKMERGLKQGCPLAALLYLVYIEPLHLRLKNSLSGFRMGKEKLFTGGFIDDVVIYVQDDQDIYTLGKIIQEFENATNAKINKEKTKFLTHGRWADRRTWPLPWMKPIEKAKILGIEFHRDVNKTIELNQIKLIQNIKATLAWSAGRSLTLHQKVIYFNQYALPLIEFVAKILPLDEKTSKRLQSMANVFIWKGCHESLKVSESIAPLQEGGLGLIDCKAKNQTSFIKTLIKDTLEENSSVQNQTKYLLGTKTPFTILSNSFPKRESIPDLFKNHLKILNNLVAGNPETDWTKISSKEIYTMIIKTKIT